MEIIITIFALSIGFLIGRLCCKVDIHESRKTLHEVGVGIVNQINYHILEGDNLTALIDKRIALRDELSQVPEKGSIIDYEI
jgi:hypothetical protein